MKIKKIILFLLVLTVFIVSNNVKANNEPSLTIKFIIEGVLDEEIIITSTKIKIFTDERAEMFWIKDENDDYLFQRSYSNDEENIVEFETSGLAYLNTISPSAFDLFVETNSIVLEMSYYNYYIRTDDYIHYHDIEGFEIELLWNYKVGHESDVIINDVKNPYTLAEIESMLNIFAFDEHDGDITDRIEIKANTYSDNIDKLGKYYIIYEVINDSEISETYKINIVNFYFGNPTISGPNLLIYNYYDEIDFDEILSLYETSDEYDEEVSLIIESHNVDEGTVGSYQINLLATSQTKGTATLTVDLKIQDKVKPQFIDHHEGVIRYNYKNLPSHAELLLNLEAFDEYDLDLTNKIQVKINNITNKIGTYEVIYEVKDNSKNFTTYTRYYEIFSVDAPKFYVSNSLLTIENINNLSIGDLAEIIIGINDIEYKSYEVIENTYSDNYNIPGTYKLSLLVTDKNDDTHLLNYSINVFESPQDTPYYKNVVLGVVLLTLLVTFNFIIIKKLKK